MSEPDRDAVTLAREVLEAQAAFDRDAEDAAHYGEVCDRLNEAVDRATPALARAVIDLTDRLHVERFAHANTAAKVKRMEALAEQMERESGIRRGRGDHPNEIGASADDLRRVLNGGGQ